MSPGRLRIAAALLLLGPFTPMLFQGEEWAASSPFRYFTDHQDAELGRAVSEGRRGEFSSFGWDPSEVPDPQDPETHRASVLRWSELDEPGHASLLTWYRDCIRLRRTRPELTDGRWDRQTVDHDPDAGWVRVRRGDVTVLAHLGTGAVTLPVPDGAELAVVEGRTMGSGATLGGGEITLDPDGVAVVLIGDTSRP